MRPPASRAHVHLGVHACQPHEPVHAAEGAVRLDGEVVHLDILDDPIVVGDVAPQEPVKERHKLSPDRRDLLDGVRQPVRGVRLRLPARDGDVPLRPHIGVRPFVRAPQDSNCD